MFSIGVGSGTKRGRKGEAMRLREGIVAVIWWGYGVGAVGVAGLYAWLAITDGDWNPLLYISNTLFLVLGMLIIGLSWPLLAAVWLYLYMTLP
jgi:hypothetical protein